MQFSELAFGQLGDTYGRFDNRGGLRRLSQSTDEFEVAGARKFTEHHLLNRYSLRAQVG
jgi:hypothetical protein